MENGIMEKFTTYGEAFRYLRESRGFTIKRTAENIVSPQFLSKFEKNNSSISLVNFSRLLVRLGVTFDDFFRLYYGESVEFIANNFDNTLNTFLSKSDILRNSKKAIPFDFRDNPYLPHLTSDLIKDYFNTIMKIEWDTDDDYQRILKYLNQFETWYTIEWDIYKLIMNHLPIEMVKFKASQVISNLINKQDISSELRRKQITILVETLRFYTRKSCNNEAESLIRFLREELAKPAYVMFTNENLAFRIQVSYYYLSIGDMRGHKFAKIVYRTMEIFEKGLLMPYFASQREEFYWKAQRLNKTGVELDFS